MPMPLPDWHWLRRSVTMDSVFAALQRHADATPSRNLIQTLPQPEHIPWMTLDLCLTPLLLHNMPLRPCLRLMRAGLAVGAPHR